MIHVIAHILAHRFKIWNICMFVCIHAFCMRACASAIWKKIKIIKISDNLKNIYSKYIILPERARLQRISISCILWAPPSPCFPLSPPLHYLSTSPDNIKKLPARHLAGTFRRSTPAFISSQSQDMTSWSHSAVYTGYRSARDGETDICSGIPTRRNIPTWSGPQTW